MASEHKFHQDPYRVAEARKAVRGALFALKHSTHGSSCGALSTSPSRPNTAPPQLFGVSSSHQSGSPFSQSPPAHALSPPTPVSHHLLGTRSLGAEQSKHELKQSQQSSRAKSSRDEFGSKVDLDGAAVVSGSVQGRGSSKNGLKPVDEDSEEPTTRPAKSSQRKVSG